jgi:hypothetical protein
MTVGIAYAWLCQAIHVFFNMQASLYGGLIGVAAWARDIRTFCQDSAANSTANK